ncbi:hypothetical protein Tco_1256093 [Tanacetum coccineum]
MSKATESAQKNPDTIPNEVVQKNPELFLDELNVGVTGTIVLMFCRIWDVNTVTGPDFVVSDGKPNKYEYRILKNDAFMLEFDGATTVRKSFVNTDGIVRYPFQLVDFDHLEPTNTKYLIDVAGYVTNVGRTTQQ